MSDKLALRETNLWKEILPGRYHQQLTLLKTVGYPELLDIVGTFPNKYKNPILDMVSRGSPNKVGRHEAADTMRVTEVKIYQGRGTDPNRPKKCIPGEMYSSRGYILGDSFEGCLLAFWEGRVLFENVDEASDQKPRLLCQSMDRLMGTLYGKCSECENRPWQETKKSDCNDTVVLYMLPKGLDDICMLRFSGTSVPVARKIINLTAKDNSNWTRWWELGTEERKSGVRQWFMYTASPEEKKKVPTEIYPFCEACAMMIDQNLFWPQLARIYRGGVSAEKGTDENVDNEENPDYGKAFKDDEEISV